MSLLAKSSNLEPYRVSIGKRSICLWLIVWLTGVCFQSLVNAKDSKPNIVFLMTDDQCTYSLGCYDTPKAQTPNLDQLATDGITFDNYYVTTAICMGSRATVMTGLYEYRHGCNFEHGPLLKKHWQQSYPILLKQAGYTTAFAGKFGFEVAELPGGKKTLPEADFDRWGGGPGQTFYETIKNKSIANYAEKYPHSTLAYGAFGSDCIREASQGSQPFCLSISFKAPHHPVTPDPRFDGVYRGQTFVKPINFGRENGEHFSLQSRQGRQYERFVSWHYRDDYDGVMAKYYQQIYAVDVAVGMIRQALHETGVAENTVIVFTSDNGFMCGSHGYGSKVLPYEESSRVPLIVVDPRRPTVQRGLRCNSLCGSIDIAPTLLALAGVDSPAGIDGTSLLPLVDEPDTSVRDSLALINVWGPRPVHSLAVVEKNWKYIYWPYAEGEFQACEELYCTADDPAELVERAKDKNAIEDLQRMRRLYQQHLENWHSRAVDYHNYQKFSSVFKRN